MNLQPFVDKLRRELLIAAEAGGDDARVLAERLTVSLESAVRLTLLEALSAAADELSRELAPGAVEVRLRGTDPTFVITAPDPSFADSFVAGIADDDGIASDTVDGSSARINLRLPESVKLRVDDAARREHLSINAWLIRAVVAALEGDGRGHRRGGPGGQRQTGWVR